MDTVVELGSGLGIELGIVGIGLGIGPGIELDIMQDFVDGDIDIFLIDGY